ncbi:MAG: hypothetical protein JO263_10345 [Candidatus Eremiobacteraeota bacterium]|nr:hypothetical protein [Candidatus Eremiobacteraeota bacterium]
MAMNDMVANREDRWPDINVARWAGTKRSLHLYSQMLGKIRLALSPPQPNWMFTALYLSPRGLTTGFIPYEGSSVEVALDVFDSSITILQSSGERSRVELLPVRTVAEIYEELSAALERVNVACYISPVPQEIPDTTPFNDDRRASEYDPAAVVRWFRAVTAAAALFETWRTHFFGRSGIQFWWGAFDLALLLFSGRKVTPPADRGYIMKYDLDAELMNVGLYLGDETTAPFFYGYIYPPPEAEHLPIAPPAASWSAQLSEWILPYDTARASSDPEATIRAFIDSVYAQCFAAAGWNRDAHRYASPPGSPCRRADGGEARHD